MDVLRWCAVLLLAGCYAPDLDGKFACASDGSCPPGLACVDRLCIASGKAGDDLAGIAIDAAKPNGCEPAQCSAAQCGVALDGCGDKLTCGSCMFTDFCGGGGPNVCGKVKCTPKSCRLQDANCGLISDGCAAVLDCGTCDADKRCGIKTPNKCD